VTSPPGNENATGKGGALLTDDADKIIDPARDGKPRSEARP